MRSRTPCAPTGRVRAALAGTLVVALIGSFATIAATLATTAAAVAASPPGFVYHATDVGAEATGAGGVPRISPGGSYLVGNVGASGAVLYKIADGTASQLPPYISNGSPAVGQFSPDAVNDAGVVAGAAIAAVTDRFGQTQRVQVAAEWSNGVLTDLPGGSFTYQPPSGSAETCQVAASDTDNADGVTNPSNASVLNDTATTVGRSFPSCPDVPPNELLFGSTGGGLMQPRAGYPQVHVVDGYPRGINASGTVVAAGAVGSGSTSDGTVEFSGSANTAPTQVVPAPWVPPGPLGANDNGGSAINDNGDVLVANPSANPVQYAVVTASNGQMTIINPSAPTITAAALNNTDTVVGADQSAGNVAFVWNPTNGLAALRDTVTNAGSVGMVSLIDATGIANTGAIVAIGMGTDTKAHVYLLTPGGVIVTNVNPSSGPVKNGPAVTVSGVGFGPQGSADTVTFCPRSGGTCLAGTAVAVNGDTSLVVDPPDATSLLAVGQHSVTTDVFVTDTHGNTSQEGSSGYIFDDLSVTKVAPASGPVIKSQRITVTGSGFFTQGAPAVTAVAFTPVGGGPGLSGTNIQVTSDGALTVDTPDATAIIPAGQTSVTVDVQVTVAGVQSPVNEPADEYSFGPLTITSLSVHQGPVDGNTLVTVIGTGFGQPGAADTVAFVPGGGGSAIAAKSSVVVSDTEIDVTTPDVTAELPSGQTSLATFLQVTDPFAQTTTNGPIDKYMFQGGLAVTSVLPPNGSPAGQFSVRLAGTGFTQPGTTAQVTFCSAADATSCVQATGVTVRTDTLITATAPKFAIPHDGSSQAMNVIVTLTDATGTVVAQSSAAPPSPQFTYAITLTQDIQQPGQIPVDDGPNASPGGGSTKTFIGSGFGNPGTGSEAYVAFCTGAFDGGAGGGCDLGLNSGTFDHNDSTVDHGIPPLDLHGRATGYLNAYVFIEVNQAVLGVSPALRLNYDVTVAAVTRNPPPTDATGGPVVASPAGATPLRITGHGFLGADRVEFCPHEFAGTGCIDGTPPTVLDDGALTTTAPPYVIGAHGTQPVNVYVEDLPDAVSAAKAISYGVAINTISPGQASTAGGTTITISGQGFGPVGTNDTVSFCPVGTTPPQYQCERIGGGLIAQGGVPTDDTTITAAVPAFPIGDNTSLPVNVYVEVPQGAGLSATRATSSPGTFTYTGAAISSATANGTGTPTGVTTTPAGQVTVTASNFSPTELVTATLHSTPVVLGSTVADHNGDITITVTIPPNTALGAHELILTGQTSHVSAVLPVTIAASTVTITPSTLPTAIGGVPYHVPLTAAGGHGPYTFTLTEGTLPLGLTLTHQGLLGGTPTRPGRYTLTITATDTTHNTATTTYTLHVTPGLCVQTTGPDPYTNCGPILSGTIKITPNGTGPIQTITGTVTIPDAHTATTTITFDLHRVRLFRLILFIGTIHIDDPATDLHQKILTIGSDIRRTDTAATGDDLPCLTAVQGHLRPGRLTFTVVP